MENAVEAFKMAFAVIVFVMALSVSMMAFNQAKATSDIILYAQDETNYYEYEDPLLRGGKAAENRIVGIETIIPTLYKYNTEEYTVLFRRGRYVDGELERASLRPLYVYETNLRRYNARNNDRSYLNYDNYMTTKYRSFFADTFFNGGYIPENRIFSFDSYEESIRHEPWNSRHNEISVNLRRFLEGGEYTFNDSWATNGTTSSINYGNAVNEGKSFGGFIQNYRNNRFVETVAEFNRDSQQSREDETHEEDNLSRIADLVKQNTNRIIIFTLIEN